jgi:hypothetical protein
MNEKLKNQWLQQNNKLVQNLKRLLLEYRYKGQDDLPSNQIQGLLESAVIEIQRLQKELDKTTNQLEELKNANKEPEKKE